MPPGSKPRDVLGVPAQTLAADKESDRAAYDRGLAAAIRECSPSLIVLAGFMRILSAPFVCGIRRKNFEHPSVAIAQISGLAYPSARLGGAESRNMGQQCIS